MAYLSYVADFLGVVFGVYFVIIGIKSHFSNRKKNLDEDVKKSDLEE